MHLNCHTYFSLRYGTLSPRRLVEKAAAWGIESLALTDINNTRCALEFCRHCRELGVNPVLGVEFRHNGEFLYLGLARNPEGWRALNELLTACSLSGAPIPASPPDWPDVWVVYPKLTKALSQFRENELLGIRPEHVNRLFSHELRHHQHKLVMLSPVTFFDDDGWTLHRLLRAVDLNTVIAKLQPRDTGKTNDRLLPPETLHSYYRQYPGILRNTRRVMESCQVDFETGLQHNRQTFTGDKAGDFELLSKLALNGCGARYGPHDRNALERVRKELKAIREQDFCAYFLIAWDVVRYARSAGYRHVGRGSGANSIVAYSIGITDVDPLELDLYFERFINPYRASPPDFDIDFSWDERDDVTDYIFKRYGREHVALLATYSTFQFNAAVRELGKVFGLSKAEIDFIADHLGEICSADWKWEEAHTTGQNE